MNEAIIATTHDIINFFNAFWSGGLKILIRKWRLKPRKTKSVNSTPQPIHRIIFTNDELDSSPISLERVVNVRDAVLFLEDKHDGPRPAFAPKPKLKTLLRFISTTSASSALLVIKHETRITKACRTVAHETDGQVTG